MSLPFHRAAERAAARARRVDEGFWGLDLAAGALGRSFARAVDTENLIWAGEGLCARPGYRKRGAFAGRINGIFAYGDRRIVHAGNALYETDAQFLHPKLLDESMNDKRSMGVVRRQRYIKRSCAGITLSAWTRESRETDILFLSDGLRYLFYDGEALHPVADADWGAGTMDAVLTGERPVFYATVPFTAVAKRPDSAAADVDPKGANRLSQFCCESFYIDGGAAHSAFLLTCLYGAFHDEIPPEVQLRDQNGVWRNYGVSGDWTLQPQGDFARLTLFEIRAGQAFSLDANGRICAMSQGNYTVADDGMDNVRITYGVHKEPPDPLDHARVQGLYGPDGADNVLFLGGSWDRPGEDAFSAPDDFLCFYETSRELLGNAKTPVTGYCRLSDGRLAVLKNDPDGPAVFFRSHQLVTLGATKSGEAYQVDAYPSQAGAAQEGCLSGHTVGMAGNEPCFLSRRGLFGVKSVSDELTNLNQTIRRSEAVDPLLETLLSEEVAAYDEAASDKAVACRFRGCYLLCFGTVALITDGKRDSGGSCRFLKWRFSHSIRALFSENGRLYLGSADGAVFAFDDGWQDDTADYDAYWETPSLTDSFDRRVLLRALYAGVRPAPGGGLSLRLYQEKGLAAQREASVSLLDFGALDFQHFSFDPGGEDRFISLLPRRVAGNAFRIRLSFWKSGGFRLFGLKLLYETGGTIR